MADTNLNRRAFSAAAISLGIASTQSAEATESSGAFEKNVVDQQLGDPSLKPETLEYDPFALQERVYASSRASYAPVDDEFPQHFISACESFIGISRKSNPSRVANFLSIFGLPFKDESGKFVPFCASGLSFAAATAYLKKSNRTVSPSTERQQLQDLLGEIDRYHFFPSPSVWDMHYVARGKRRWVDRASAPSPKPGWLVIYDWKRNGGADHVGVVERVEGGQLHTIEFNTAAQPGSGSESDGGTVTRRVRKLDATVKGFVKTDLRSPFEKDS